MSEQITAILKRKIEDLATYGGLDAETRRNALKEELQYYVLNFIYHHPEYNNWIMYGGSALRIIYGLDRMSVDLDFEISHVVTEKFLKELKKEIEEYFLNTYGAGADFITVKITTGRGLLLKFYVDEELSFGRSSKQVHVKIDLNHFVAPKTVTERWPINRDQFSFVIVTYNMASLMASKLAAIFLRGTRGVGKDIFGEKGRDIYDLLWYMGKKVVPDFDYLVAKEIDVNDPRMLFDKLTIQMNKVSDKNLEQDLGPLFTNKTFIDNWLKNWRESYFRLLDGYQISSIKKLREVVIHGDFYNSCFSFIYFYETEGGGLVEIKYILSDYWFVFREGDLTIEIDSSIKYDLREKAENVNRDKLLQYMTLFKNKNEKYFNKTNGIMLREVITTKMIRMTAENFNQKEQILLNKSALLSCGLDDLLK